MKGLLLIIFPLTIALLMSSCVLRGKDQPIYKEYSGNFSQARENFHTVLLERKTDGNILMTPPDNTLEMTEYQSTVGMLSAYVTPDPKDGRKHPAIIWVIGEFSNTPDSTSWEGPPSAFMEQGIVTLYPSFRGGGNNPGNMEYLYGEVDDLIAAANYLSSLSYVDSERIYLGGHSSGGTLALLAAETAKDLFRAVFSFGPVGKIELYDVEFPFDTSDEKELAVRSPIRWLDCIRSKTFVIEGMLWGNMEALSSIRAESKNENITFYAVKGYDHISILLPGCSIIAEKITRDTNEQCNISMSLNDFKQYAS